MHRDVSLYRDTPSAPLILPSDTCSNGYCTELLALRYRYPFEALYQPAVSSIDNLMTHRSMTNTLGEAIAGTAFPHGPQWGGKVGGPWAVACGSA